MRRQFCAAIVFGFTLLCAGLLTGPRAPLAAADNPRKPASNFVLKDAKGTPVTLASYKGKVVLLNFWATWCHGCVEEMPWFMEFQSKYQSDGLAVIGVSMDDDGWKSVAPFVQEKKVNYTVVIGDKKLGDEFGLAAMPMTLLIDRAGNIVSQYQGVVDREACEKQLRSLIEEKPTL